MATDKKISELADADALTGPEFVEVVQGGVNKKTTTQAIANLGGASGTSIPFGSTSGTNTYTIAATPAVASYTNGMLIQMRVVNSSTGLVTLNFDSVGAKKLVDTDGTQATDGYLKAGVDYLISYNTALDGGAGAFTVVNEIQHGVMNLRGVYAASGGLYPSGGGSGPSGAIRHGDTWVISGTDTIGSLTLRAGDLLTTAVDAPGQTASNWYWYPGATTMALMAPLAGSKTFPVKCTDDVTPIGVATVFTFRMPYAMTLTGIRAGLTTAQASGSIFTVDVREAGVTILSTLITIDNTEKTSVTAATPPVISDTSLADDAEITILVTQIGNGSAIGLQVTFIG